MCGWNALPNGSLINIKDLQNFVRLVLDFIYVIDDGKCIRIRYWHFSIFNVTEWNFVRFVIITNWIDLDKDLIWPAVGMSDAAIGKTPIKLYLLF